MRQYRPPGELLQRMGAFAIYDFLHQEVGEIVGVQRRVWTGRAKFVQQLLPHFDDRGVLAGRFYYFWGGSGT